MFEKDKVKRPKSLDEMTKEEFDAIMEAGLRQAQSDGGIPVEEAFESIRNSILQ